MGGSIFRADIRTGNRIDLVAEDPPGGQPLDVAPIERNEAGVSELRRGAQFAGAERGRRTSDPGEVAFDRIKTFGQRQGSREARVLDPEAGLGGNPARVLELVGDEAVPPAGKGSMVGMGAASVRIGSEPNVARPVAFVIPAVGHCCPGFDAEG